MATVLSDHIYSRRYIGQNLQLIWLNPNVDGSKEDCQNILSHLRNIIGNVNIYTEPDECIDFLTEFDDIKVFLIVSHNIAQKMTTLIHDIPQVDSIYIFSHNKLQFEQWSKKWMKIKGIGNEIAPICACFHQAVKQCNQDSIAVSFIAVDEEISTQNLDRLEPSFMYTQLFKDILLGMKYDQQSIKDFISYCQNGDYGSPTNITRFENEYNAKSAVWWYTFPSFIYSMLNDALRMLEGDTIIKMGFFIYDLHCQIEQLYQKQIGSYNGKAFTVYRGQGLSKSDFEKVFKTKDGLISFNNFLSTSSNREVALEFANSALTKTDTVGILFKMSIDCSISSVPFAAIQQVSYFQTEEEEILFSMHTIFRINEIHKIDNNGSLYQVELKLTADDDPQLRTLTKYIREAVAIETGLEQLASLLGRIGQYEAAEKLFKVSFENTSNKYNRRLYYGTMGILKQAQGDYKTALWYFDEELAIQIKVFPPNHPLLVLTYSKIGLAYKSMGDYPKALSFLQKSVEISEETTSLDFYVLDTPYNNIGIIYADMGDYRKAISFLEKSIEIREKTLPSNHPLFASSYSNIASVYHEIGDFSTALLFHNKALEINKNTLPSYHPELARYYNNIAMTYNDMGEYQKALSFYEKIQEVFIKVISPNDPNWVTHYSNMGLALTNIGKHSEALLTFKKGLKVSEKVLSSNDPLLGHLNNNIGLTYERLGEYSKALSFYEKSLEISQKNVPKNHPTLATVSNNIGVIYAQIGQYAKALSYLEHARDIWQRSLLANHPNLQRVCINIKNLKEIITIFEKLNV